MARPRPTLQKPLLPPRTTGALPTHDVDGRPFVRLQTLGAVNILVGTVRLGATAGMQFSLLLRVATAPSCQLGRRAAIDALWPDLDDTRQRGNLRQALYKLRGLGVHIALDGAVVALDPTQLLRTFSTERSADLFARDVTLGHEPFGPCLPGFTAPWPTFQDWLDDYRDTVHSDVRRVLSAQLRQRRERADWGGAEALARWLLQFDPLNEEGTLTVAECAALAGSKTEALAILDRYLAELGPDAGDIRLPASMLRRRIAEPVARTRLSFAPTERHFLGRNDELAELTLAMRRARWHDGSAMLWHGAPGIGKSRLAHELTKVAVLEGVRVLMAPCRESDGLRPLSVFIDLVPELLSQPGALGCAPESLAALRRLVPSDRRSGLPGAPREAERTVHDSEAVDDHRVGDELDDDFPVREPMPMLAALRSALIDLIAAISHEKPTLLVVDDAHWIDESSWDVLAELIDRVGALRVCVVMLSREPHARPQRPQRVPLTLRVQALAPLSAESCLALSRAIGADLSATIDDALGAWFVRASEGNPLFLRALVNHWIETGEAGGVPPTLHGVIEQRLSQLSGDALRVLQTAALLGKWATVERVGRVLELGVSKILGLLGELALVGAFRSAKGSSLDVFELLGQIAVDALPGPSASLLHTQIAKVLVHDDATASLTSRDISIAEHLAASGNLGQLREFVLESIRHQMDLDMAHGAIALCDHVVSRFPELFGDDDFSRCRWRLVYSAGQYARLLEGATADSFIDIAEEGSNDERAADAIRVVEIAERAMFAGDYADLCARGLLIAHDKTVSVLLRIKAAIAVTRTSAVGVGSTIARNAYDVGLRLCEEAAEYSVEKAELEMYYHTLYGSIESATSSAVVLLSAAEKAASSSDRLRLRGDCAYALMCSSQLGEAKQLLASNREEALRCSAYSRAAAATHNLSILGLASDDLEAARIEALECLRIALLSEDPYLNALANKNLSRIELIGGDAKSARSYLDLALEHPNVACHPKWKAFDTAIRLGLAVALSEKLSVQLLLPQAEEAFENLKRYVGQDFLASQIAAAYASLGAERKAVELLVDYVTHARRERFPYPFSLVPLSIAEQWNEARERSST